MPSVEFDPPKQVIEFRINNEANTTGQIEEFTNPPGFQVYIDGEEHWFTHTLEDAVKYVQDYAAEC